MLDEDHYQQRCKLRNSLVDRGSKYTGSSDVSFTWLVCIRTAVAPMEYQYPSASKNLDSQKREGGPWIAIEQSYQQDSLGTGPALRLLMVGPRITFSMSSASGQGRPRRRRSPPSLYLDVQSAGPGKSQAVPAVRVVGCMRPSVADTSATGLAQHSYATFDRSR